MPLIESSRYEASTFLTRHAHLSTIYPAKIKKYPIPHYEREKMPTDDGDFLNLDWRKQENTEELVILFHGLEGDSKRTYLNSCSDYFFERGYSILAWNHRSCGGEMNATCRLYHHGSTDDIDRVIKKAIAEDYKKIYLIGYSMGGALILNYLGSYTIDQRIQCAVSFSSPLSLQSSAEQLSQFPNTVYFKNFKRTLVPKFRQKAEQFPGQINEECIDQLKSFADIDNYFTAPMHGYRDKDDYYKQASPLKVIDKITIPCLVVNAANDPFLGEACYPRPLLAAHPSVYLEIPAYGGHCGFIIPKEKHSWAEIRALEFIEQMKGR